MARIPELMMKNIEHKLRAHEGKGVLRFITCGDVDDGKRTLIGRLLYESKILLEDPLTAVETDLGKFGTPGAETDDVAYQFFSTDKRNFIVADTFGGEHYILDMVTGKFDADVAIVMIDARKGVLSQTRRHSYLASLVGIRHVVVAINKMDLVDYDEAVFCRIVSEFKNTAKYIGFDGVVYIPMSAFNGDNIVSKSKAMSWFVGPALLDFLEHVELDDARSQHMPFRFLVQWVNRPDLNFRGFAGQIAGGEIKVGDRVRIQPSGKESSISRIVTADGDLKKAVSGQSITLTLAHELDVSRGDVISTSDAPAEVAAQFEVSLVWMHEEPLLPGRPYVLKIGARQVNASVTEIKYQLNIDTLEHVAAKKLELNAIGICNISLDCSIAFDPYSENRYTGGFIFIDRLSNNTVGAGMIHFALRRAHNIHMQHVDVDKASRAAIKGQKPCLLWFTGLSGAGKSTIANLVEKKLYAMGHHTYLLDGDNVRHGLNKDLGFTDVDRVENIRRVAEVAKLMVDAGLIVLSAFISPFRMERQMARDLVESDEFLEIFVDAPLSTAEARDPKGLYKKARRGELKNFTGIDSPYEPPEFPEIRLATVEDSAEALAEKVIDVLRHRGFV